MMGSAFGAAKNGLLLSALRHVQGAGAARTLPSLEALMSRGLPEGVRSDYVRVHLRTCVFAAL